MTYFFRNHPTKLLKTQERCPESDKTIPISDTFWSLSILGGCNLLLSEEGHQFIEKIGRFGGLLSVISDFPAHLDGMAPALGG